MCVGCYIIKIISPEGGQGVPGGARLGYEGEVPGQLEAGDLHVSAPVAPVG